METSYCLVFPKHPTSQASCLGDLTLWLLTVTSKLPEGSLIDSLLFQSPDLGAD